MITLQEPQKVASLFADCDSTMVWSCLQGVMGSLYVNDRTSPVSAIAVLGDFTFLAGKPDKEMIRHLKSDTNGYRIIITQNPKWRELIVRVFGDEARAITRYAMRKDAESFDTELLRSAVSSLPSGYRLRMMDEELFHRCREQSWTQDFIIQFPEYEAYSEPGLGAIVLLDGQIVSGASSYSRYDCGIEIEVDTRIDQRQKGLAYRCCAKLILECLERDLFPSWDAHTETSFALARKLGYQLDHTYPAYEVTI